MSFVDADRWAKFVEGNPRFRGHVDFARFDAKGRVGTWTTEEKKKVFMVEMQRTVPTCKFAQEFITSRVDPAGIQKDLIEEMRHFRLDIVAPKGEDSTALTSKFHVTGKSPGKKDDLTMAFGIALFHAIQDAYDPVFKDRMEKKHKRIMATCAGG